MKQNFTKLSRQQMQKIYGGTEDIIPESYNTTATYSVAATSTQSTIIEESDTDEESIEKPKIRIPGQQ